MAVSLFDGMNQRFGIIRLAITNCTKILNITHRSPPVRKHNHRVTKVDYIRLRQPAVIDLGSAQPERAEHRASLMGIRFQRM